MKKTLVIFILILVLIISHLLQYTIFKKFTMFNVMANIVLLFFVFVATYTNKGFSYILSFIYGFFVDIRYGNPIGVTAFALIILIELTIALNLLLYVNSRIATMIKILFLTIIFELVKYILRVILLSFDIDLISFGEIVLIEGIYNMLILMVIYPLFKYSGEITDEIYNRKKVLTRYF